MKHTYHITLKSSNAKTGPIPVSTTSGETCPDSCPLKGNGCYAAGGPLGMHWRQVTAGKRGTDLKTFCDTVKALPVGQVWRHNQAGDLPGDQKRLDAKQVSAIVDANKGKRGFTYTHYAPAVANNAQVIKSANENGFTVNLSADNLTEADAFKALGIGPVAVVLPVNTKQNVKTAAGNLVVLCPATQRDDVTCASCKLCAWADRKVIVGFPAHGASKRKAELVTLNTMAATAGK